METKLKWKMFYLFSLISMILMLMGIWNDGNKWFIGAGAILFLVNIFLGWILIPESEEKKEVESVH